MILIVTNNAWYAYNFRFNLARFLKEKGFRVAFVMPYDNKYTTLIEEEFPCYDLRIDAKGINPINDFKSLMNLYKLYKSLKPEIVLNFTIKPNIYSSIICGILGIKCISNITGLGTIFIKETIVTKIAKVFYRYSLMYNQKVFFQNKDDLELFIANNLINKEISYVLPGSGVDLKRFVPIKPKKRNNKFVFLLIARLLRDKGVIELIEATKILKLKYKDFEVHLLGAIGVANNTAITKEELEEWVETGLVKYLGQTDNVQEVIAQVDCVVLPSYREGTPRSLLEACAMEKPIIATNVVGCKDVVDDGENGFLCMVKDSRDLANKMEMMLKLTEDERANMGQLGRKKIIREFDENIVLEIYLETIQKVLG